MADRDIPECGQDRSEMLSLRACRRILGPAGKTLSDVDLERLRRETYELAGFAVDAFLLGVGKRDL